MLADAAHPAHRGVRRIAAGFVIERLMEPTPDPAMQNSHPDAFEKLSREPGFIFFKLRKVKQQYDPN
jgi:hypothetical protein